MTYKPLKRAVALEYGKLAAPIMTAKGQGEIAELIIEEAKKQGVHIAEDPLKSVVRGTGLALKNYHNFPFIMR